MENYEKKYKEVFEKAKALYKASEPMSGCNVIIETLFPELAESEDEKIKNRLIKLIKMSNEVGGFALHKWEADEMLAWIDKQGEQKPADSYCQENCKGFQETGKCFVDGECKAKREAEQELTDLNEFINELSKQFPDVSFAKLLRIVVRVAKWAKSNDEEKSKVQPKQEWSEEDKDYYDAIIAKLEVTQEDAALTDNQMDFLKSLRPQNTWKPSDEQMMALLYHCSNGSVLSSLYNDLNKLKEE